jgi:hypothetical protein
MRQCPRWELEEAFALARGSSSYHSLPYSSFSIYLPKGAKAGNGSAIGNSHASWQLRWGRPFAEIWMGGEKTIALTIRCQTSEASIMNPQNSIRIKTVKLIGRLLQPLVEEGLIAVPERNEILSNLKSLSERGELIPQEAPKLIDQTAAAELLDIGLSNFKKLEREGAFPFKRRMVGSAVRYRNTDIIKFIMSEEMAGAFEELAPTDEAEQPKSA